MSFDSHKNLLIGTVQTAPSPSTSGTSLTLMPGDGARFAPDMPVTLSPPDVEPTHDNSEVAYVTGVAGEVLTLLRGQEDTTAMQVLTGWKVRGSLTTKTITDIEDALDTKADVADIPDISGKADKTYVDTQDAMKVAKGSLVYNVKDYGATGNGSTDDTAAINNAISAAGDGGVVYLPSGTYIVDPSVSINLLSAQTLAGVGRGSVIKVKGGANVLNNIVKVESRDGVKIKDLAIDGNRANLSASDAVSVNYGVYIAGSDNCRVENVYVHHTTGVGIHVYDSTGTVVTGSESAYNRYHGFECEQDTSTVWQGNRGHHNDRHGIFVSPGEVGGTGTIANVLDGNSFDNNGQYGVAFGIDAAGLSIGLTRDNVVSNNIITKNAHYGVSLYRVDDTTVTGNLITENGYFGLYAYRSQRNQISDNRLHNNSQASNGAYDEILLEGSADGTAAKDNVIAHNSILINGANKARYAISEASSGDGPNYVYGNVIPSAGTFGRLHLQHASTQQMVDDKSDQAVAGKKVFTTGFGAAANSVKPDDAIIAVDAPFGDAVGRIVSSKGTQLVTGNGPVDLYVSDGATQNNVASFYNNHMSMHGYRIEDLADGTASAHAVTKGQLDSGLAAKQNSLGYTAENVANKGQAGGYASLDGGGKVPITQLPSTIMEYKGTWNASTNSPALADGTGDQGDVYRVSVAGTRNLGSGSITFDVGDYVIYNGSAWEKSDTTDAVASVAGKTGNVTLTSGDVGLGNVDNTSDATKNSAAVTLTNKTIDSPQIINNAAVATGGMLSLFNTSDQVTNYERGRFYWNSNVLTLIAEAGGTGTFRNMQISANGTFINLTGSGVVMGRNGTTSNTDPVSLSTATTFGGSSLIQSGVTISPTINQSGTAGYSAVKINPTETATGSGVKNLIQAQVGNTNRFRVDNLGNATISSAATTGLVLYNTSDETTNTERARHYWSSNQYIISTENGGTGVARVLRLTAGTRLLDIGGSSAHFDFQSTTTANVPVVRVSPSLGSTTGVQYAQSIAPSIAQSSTGGYTALLINPTETTTGSGAKNLIDLQVGGSSKAKIDNTGKVTAVGYREGVVNVGTVSTTATISLTNGTMQVLTLTASTACTITPPTLGAGDSCIIYVKQDATTGNGTATFTGVKWPAAGAPTITAAAGKMDIITLSSPDGTNIYGAYSQGYSA